MRGSRLNPQGSWEPAGFVGAGFSRLNPPHQSA